MSSDTRIQAQMILDNILGMIDKRYIYKRINEPIEKAALSFSFAQPEAIDHQSFNAIIINFVIHLFNKGHSIKISSPKIALAEAVAIIEMGYQGSGNGYYSALLDAMNSETNGLEIIVRQIKEIIITLSINKHIQWVYESHIAPLEWSTKTAIAEILLDQWKRYLPQNIHRTTPAQMADHIPALLNLIQTSEDKVKKLTGNH
jgi:hypothetical protein